MRVTSAPITAFHSTLVNALCDRLQLPSPLPPSASSSLTQPGVNGGLGLRDMALIIPAAKWASAASVAADITPLIDAHQVPLISPAFADRKAAHRTMVDAGARADETEEEREMAIFFFKEAKRFNN